MPRSKSGVKRQPVNQDNITCGVEKVLSKELSIREASRRFKISKTTLIRHINKFKKLGGGEIFKYEANNNTKQVFTTEEELNLKDYLVIAARLHYGLTKIEVRCLAYEFAVANEKAFPTSWEVQKRASKG